MEQVCFDQAPAVVATIVTGLVTVASVVANFVKADSVLGKIVHYLALNIKATSATPTK